MRKLVGSVAAVTGVAALLRLVFGPTFANYDAMYSLVWGRQFATGDLPAYDAFLAPTPKPLANAAGALLAPLAHDAETAIVMAALLALGALAYAVYRVGAIAGGAAVGVVAALIMLTREPVLSYGLRAYIDIPYVALVLGAVALEMKRRDRGAPVLALLALAGLLRPEAWLLSLAYVALLWSRGLGSHAARLLPLAAAAPLIWGGVDLVVTGNPLWSLTGTRDNAEVLGRVTGIQNVPLTMPRRLGEIVREPTLFAAAGGAVFGWLALRRRVAPLAAAAALAVAAFCVLATAGLPILGRYLMLPAAIVCVFAAFGLLGWTQLKRGHRWRTPWLVFSGAALLAFVAFNFGQAQRLERLDTTLATQQRIGDDLHRLADSGAFRGDCEPVSVPNHRPVPQLALWLGRDPGGISSGRVRAASAGYFIAPATAEVERTYILDPRDRERLSTSVPAGFEPAGGNGSWRVFSRCDRVAE